MRVSSWRGAQIGKTSQWGDLEHGLEGQIGLCPVMKWGLEAYRCLSGSVS